MSNDQVIFHHYPQSPVSEKVRVVLGMKDIAWKSVIIPRLLPKPNLMPLTGGYRLTPVMQIGGDIYCDSKCIINELERRFPNPTLFPNLSDSEEAWDDGILFLDVVNVALADTGADMPPEFLADRGPLYFGKGFSLDALKSKYEKCLTNIHAQFGIFNERLKSQNFILGANPGLSDALVYYLVWFLRGRMKDGDQFLQQFENLLGWEQRIKDIGHGNPEDMSDLEALDIAKNSGPQTPEQVNPDDPLGLSVGDKVAIEQIGGSAKVMGILHSLWDDHIAIMRKDEQVGQVCVHFPRADYLVKLA